MRSSVFFKDTSGARPAVTLPEDKTLVYESPDGHTMIWKTVLDQRVVALKILKAGFRHDQLFLGRLRREYEIGQNLKHPGVCETLGWVADCGEGPGIILEWIEGDTLESLLAAGSPLPAGKIASELCEAVAYLHRKQVIHKDLKPSNILITRRGQNVKLIDFGLSDADSIITGKEPAGTLDYAAPEVVAGAQASERSDIYSLGKVLGQLAPEFTHIASVCCATSPEKRPASAEEVLAALARPSGRKRPLWPVLLAVALVLLAAIAIALALLLPRPDEVKSLFEDAVRTVRDAAIVS